MDFAFTEEQQALADALRRFVGERYGFEYRKQVRASSDGWSRETWAQMAELGLLSVNVPEADGGLGGGAIEAMLVGNVIGEALLLEPYLASSVAATRAIVELASPAQRAQWLPALMSGELIAVLANGRVQAVRDGKGWRLDGTTQLTYHAAAADLLLLPAQTDKQRVALFAVPANSPGLELSPSTTVDDQRAATATVTGVTLSADDRLGDDAGAALQRVRDFELAALCAEALGAMDKLLAATIEYTRSRVQFGAPIGSFQALQHRMAEMLIHLEQSRSMTYLAASAVDNPDADARRNALDAAKVLMGRAARFIGQQAVQLHGGIGMTDELNVSHYFKRLTAFELRCGSTGDHLRHYVARLQSGTRNAAAANRPFDNHTASPMAATAM